MEYSWPGILGKITNGIYILTSFYKEEIKRISLLGHDEDLDWKFTRSGLVVDLPDEPPTEHAHVLKIERHHHPPIE